MHSYFCSGEFRVEFRYFFLKYSNQIYMGRNEYFLIVNLTKDLIQDSEDAECSKSIIYMNIAITAF